MKTFLALVLLIIGSAVALPAPVPSPEIDPASGSSAIALLAAGLLVLRGRKR
jgi:hypothetical protein